MRTSEATQNAGSHNNVAIAVYKGDCDAGVTFVNVLTDTAANLAAQYPDIATKVVPFAVTDRIPNDGMQFIKSLDPKLQAVIVEGMLAMTKDPGGKAVLKSLYNYDSLVQVEAQQLRLLPGCLDEGRDRSGNPAAEVVARSLAGCNQPARLFFCLPAGPLPRGVEIAPQGLRQSLMTRTSLSHPCQLLISDSPRRSVMLRS